MLLITAFRFGDSFGKRFNIICFPLRSGKAVRKQCSHPAQVLSKVFATGLPEQSCLFLVKDAVEIARVVGDRGDIAASAFHFLVAQRA